jgi:GNAT superfamily N-acetyltransferase
VIRPATEPDIPRLLKMGARFIAETPYKNHIFANPEQMEKLAKQLMASGGVLVYERDGELIGMLGYVVFPHYVSGELIAGEVFWWVEPEARGIGRELMKVAEEQARAAGAKRFQFVAPTERVAKLYERLGYERVEVMYQRALP